MVRLAYTCPRTSVLIISRNITERAVMHRYHDLALVQCAACQEYHHPKVRECKIFRVAGNRSRARDTASISIAPC